MQIDSMQIKNINIAILAMADAPQQSLNLTSEVDHTACPENTNYFAKPSPSNLRQVFKSIQNFYRPMWPSKVFDSKTLSSRPAGLNVMKEFTMTNVQQMNLIGFYYHGYVSMHIISSQSFSVNL